MCIHFQLYFRICLEEFSIEFNGTQQLLVCADNIHLLGLERSILQNTEY